MLKSPPQGVMCIMASSEETLCKLLECGDKLALCEHVPLHYGQPRVGLK